MQSKAPPAQIHAMADINDASEVNDASSVIILAQAEVLDERQPINSDFVLKDSQSMSTMSRIFALSRFTATRAQCPQQWLQILATWRFTSTRMVLQMFYPCSV
jgi:hypothetical protein